MSEALAVEIAKLYRILIYRSLLMINFTIHQANQSPILSQNESIMKLPKTH